MSKIQNKPKIKYFVAESSGYIMCVERADMLVADVGAVVVGDVVKFKYRVETFSGVLTFMSVSEEDALREMKVQSKAKRTKPESSSGVHSDKRLRIKVVQGDDINETAASTSKSKAKNAARDMKKKKALTEYLLDDELAGVSSQISNLECSPVSSLMSESDDDAPLAKKQGRNEDIRKLANISDDSEPDTSAKATSGSRANIKNDMNKANKEEERDKVIADHGNSKEIDQDAHSKQEKRQCDKDHRDDELCNKRIRAKSRKVETKATLKRNCKVYEGSDGRTYLYSESTPNAVKIHPSYEVFTQKNILEKALNSKTASICCRFLLDNVYTEESLQNASAFGFPPRGKGSKHMTPDEVLPRLDPKGIEAIMARALEHQVTFKTWRPKITEIQLRNSITNKVCLAKQAHQPHHHEDKSSSSSDLEF